MRLTSNTPAKINVFLDVLGIREDGYHRISTLFLPLKSPVDTIVLSDRQQPGLTLQCSNPSVPQGEGNLCYRAATAFCHAIGREPNWHIEIDKKIPVAAGLGGGSSNAATVLRLLNEASGNLLSAERLRAVATALGADVPFFLDPVPARGSGIGDMIEPLSTCVSLPIVLINPAFPISAQWAYANLDRTQRAIPPMLERLVEALSKGDIETVAACTFNALEFAVRDKFPLVDMMLEFLFEQGCAAAHVSGSGPTVYGLCHPTKQEHIAEAARKQFGPGFEVFSTETTGI